MTQLRKKVLEELERRNYAQATARAYVGAIRQFAEYFHRSPDQLGVEHIRQYQLHLVHRKLHPKSIQVQMAALRFLFGKVLRRGYSHDDLPLPKLLRRQIPIVLSRDEVARLIASAANLEHRTILMALYSTGMRRSELCHLQPADIDKERMVIRIRQGKGGKDREVPLSQTLLDQLRTYYRSLQRKSRWIFPSRQGHRTDQPITDKVVWHACRQATLRAGIAKPVHPHTIRHYLPSRIMSGNRRAFGNLGGNSSRAERSPWRSPDIVRVGYRLFRNARTRSPGLYRPGFAFGGNVFASAFSFMTSVASR